MLSFEGKRIDVGANKLKLRRFKSRAFFHKMRSFCTNSASTFWKIQPEMATKRYSLRDFASSGHVSTLANAKVRQNALCCLILIFQRTDLVGFSKRLSTVTSPVSRVPPPPPPKLSSPKLL